jgi:hypothetical protein
MFPNVQQKTVAGRLAGDGKFDIATEKAVSGEDHANCGLDRSAKVDPAVIQTVLNWENRSDIPVGEFFDNSAVDRIIKEGFVERLYK